MKRNEASYAKVAKGEIYNYRSTLGLSQVNMAKKMGLSHRMWNHYEHGTKSVPISVVLSAKYLCQNIDKMEELHDDIKEHKDYLTDFDVNRINRLVEASKSYVPKDIDPLIKKIMAQFEREMGFLLSKMN